MGARKAVMVIRDLLVEKRHDCDGRENQASVAEIIEAFQVDNAELIHTALPELKTMALTTLFYEGKRRKPTNITPAQSSFLSAFGVSDFIYVPLETNGKLKPQDTTDSTLDEIEAYADRLPDLRKGGGNKDKYRLMVEKLRPYETTPGMTAAQCWATMEAAAAEAGAEK